MTVTVTVTVTVGAIFRRVRNGYGQGGARPRLTIVQQSFNFSVLRHFEGSYYGKVSVTTLQLA